MYHNFLNKSYKKSLRATILSIFSVFMNFSGLVFIATTIYSYFNQENLRSGVVLEFIIISSIFLAIGIILGLIARKVGKQDFNNRIKKDLSFAIAMAEENPESKQLYMELNPQFAEYVFSGNETLYEYPPLFEENSYGRSKYMVTFAFFGIVIAIVVSTALFLTTGNSSSNSASVNEDKYSIYAELSNEMLWREFASVTPYTEQFGSGDTVIIPKDEVYGVMPVLDSFYGRLDDIREEAQGKPKTYVDDSAIQLIDETKELYKVINEVSAYYEGQHKTDNLARTQELHTKYISEIKIWKDSYSKFLTKLKPMADTVRSNDLDWLKKEGQDYDYYTLKLVTDCDAIITYLSDNGINDTNLLTKDLTDYKKLLSNLEETYKQYKVNSQGRSGTVHLEVLNNEFDYFVSGASRVVKVVDAQDMKAGIVSKKGGVIVGGTPLPVERLNFHFDRMVSAYNSSVRFEDFQGMVYIEKNIQ
ncbi:MAG: DUF3829 domain-containing protein [Clostridiaceae bacterium]